MSQRQRPELSGSVSADPIGANRRVPRTFRPGRTCAAPGCGTLLSVYNSAKHCAAHGAAHLRARSARTADLSVDTALSTGETLRAAPPRPVVSSPRRRVAVSIAPSGEVRRQAS